MKPFSESSVQNQTDIFLVLKELLKDKHSVLEIGSGTGQHAVFFAKGLPHVIWHTSDQQQYHHGIQQWLDEAKLTNTRLPLTLHVSENQWPTNAYDAVFSANVVHIMSWKNVIRYFEEASKVLMQNGLFILYGPFNFNGEFTSTSNARFDQWLKDRDPESGVRDFEALDHLAEDNDLLFQHDIEMPTNNRILCWKKKF